MAERKTAGRKPLAATAKRLSRIGLAALSASTGLLGQPASSMPSITMRMPAAMQTIEGNLAGHAKAIKTQFTAHLDPETALKIITEKDYEGMSKPVQFFAATADLTRMLAVYPDWLAGEHFAQASRFILDPNTVSKMDPMSTNPNEYNGHILAILKRARQLVNGEKGISSLAEFGGLTASEELRRFYNKIGPSEITPVAKVYKEAFEEYRDNNVFWDAFIVKYGLKPTIVVDSVIARGLEESKDQSYLEALKNASQSDKDFIYGINHRGERNGSVVTSLFRGSRTSKGNYGQKFERGTWMNAFNSASFFKDKNLSTVIPDERDYVVSHGSIVPEDSAKRWGRLAVFYDDLGKWLWDEKGNVRKELVTQKDLRDTAEAKIAVLQRSIDALKVQPGAEQEKEKRGAFASLVKAYKDRIQSLQEKYVKQQ